MRVLNNYLSNALIKAKKHPMTFIGNLYSILYGLLAMVIGLASLSFNIGFAGMYIFFFGIAKSIAYDKYVAIQRFDDKNARKQMERQVGKWIAISAAIMAFLHFSFAIVSMFFHDTTPAEKNMWIMILVAVATFIMIAIAIVNTIKHRKNKSMIFYYLKLINLSNTLISLSILQRSMLYYFGYEHAKLVGGIGGIFFSICAALVCVIMFYNIYRYNEKKRNQ